MSNRAIHKGVAGSPRRHIGLLGSELLDVEEEEFARGEIRDVRRLEQVLAREGWIVGVDGVGAR